MISPAELFETMRKKIKREWKLAFLTAFLIGLAVHMPVMLSDIPNHDGLGSLYFDQNMITSGRWFLMIACGFSSFYSIPWVIGLLGMFFLGLAAAALTELLELKKTWAIVAVSGLLVTFPALASVFAYIFTMDGYMLALLLSVLAVLFTKKRKLGFLPGAVCLALSLGTYQAYLSFAMLLAVYSILLLAMEEGEIKDKIRKALNYLYMGILGVGLYYVILQVLLKLQGKVLADYQNINGMASGMALTGIFGTVKEMYMDFFGFSLKGNVLFNNWLSLCACVILTLSVIVVAVLLAGKRKWWKNLWFFAIMVVTVALLPLATNIILLISPGVNYHLLMRYQWVLFLICMTAFVSRYADEFPKKGIFPEWAALFAAFVLVFFYGITDNIGYSNLQKRYEKTYAYCVRLLDRIEQTEGYYQGIPIAMVGVVGDREFPGTDITLPVTSGMTGLNGDVLLYTGENYRIFIQNYLGATLNILPPEAMEEMYNNEEYVAMDCFPGENSIRIIDGIMYIKTENINH